MDAKTEQMIFTLGAGVLKKGLITLGSIAATHGIINGSQTETFVSVGLALAGLIWSFWQDYGKAIILSQLEVLKAKSLAQAEKMRTAGVSPVTVQQIANQSDKMTPADVTKAVATLPAEVKANVIVPLAKVLLIAFALSFLAGDPAQAQTKGVSVPFDPFGLNKIAQSPIIKFFSQWADDDIGGAATMSMSIPELPDPTGQACWQTFGALGKIVKQHPLPATFKLAQDIEGGRLFIMALKNVCKKPECTQMFADLSNQIGALVPIPTGLSFTAICAKIP